MKKRLLLSFAVFVALSAAGLRAQDVVATWQGTLQAGRDLRTVIKISNDGGLKAVMYSIDQGGAALPGTVTLQGSTIKNLDPRRGRNL